jgi:O-methyltransferase involved in polyketide biosynthesis
MCRLAGSCSRGLDARAKKNRCSNEGLLIYFTPDEVESLAADLAGEEHFQAWIIDLDFARTTQADAAHHWKRSQ